MRSVNTIVRAVVLFWLFVTMLVPQGSFEQSGKDSARVQAATPAAVAPTKLDAGLSALLYRIKVGDITPGSEVDGVIKHIEKLGGIDIHIRGVAQLTPPQLAAIESAGATLSRKPDGSVARLDRFYSARAPLNRVEQLASLPFISTLETSFWPPPKLAVASSVPDTRAPLAWQMRDSSNRKLTGKGIIIGNHDTGVDQFHPDFWRNNPSDPNQQLRRWTDLGQAGYHPGEDVVVGLESEGKLRHINTTANPDFEWMIDFLYIDRPPPDGVVDRRDFGPDDGFSETSPSYGEKLFMVYDTNANGIFDSDDQLVPLWTSKFYAIYYLPDGQSVPIRRQRGLDLIRAARDTDGHGTQTSGVMAAGRVEETKSTPNRTYIGMAPDADYIMGNWMKNQDKEYQGVDLQYFQDNARADGARIMNYSWGFGLYWQFLDGSSAAEGRIDALANPQQGPGIPQVVSAGNEAEKGVQFYRAATPRGETVDATFDVPVIPPPQQGQPDLRVKWVKQSVLWLSSKGTNVAIAVTRPGSPPRVIGVGVTDWQEVVLGTDKLRWRTASSTASDPMVRVDTWITNVNDTQPIQTGVWTIAATNWNGTAQNPVATGIDGYMGDNQEVVRFGGAYVSSSRTMTSPATATHSIAVGAHQDGLNGPIAGFSSRGPRINGGKTIDITAPGSDIDSPDSGARTGGTYGRYATGAGGTSFAAPHVAGAIALMLQDNSSLTAADIKQRLKQTALKDGRTGPNPDPDTWGAGKLNIYTALTKAATKLVNDRTDPADNVAISRVSLEAIKNNYTGVALTNPIPGGLGSFTATIGYDNRGISLLGVRGIAPFTNPNPQWQTVGNQTTLTLSSSQQGSQPQPSLDVAYLVPRLVGSKDDSYSLTLNFQEIKAMSGGDNFLQEATHVIGGLRRGDARADGVVTIVDALFIAQNRAQIRDFGDETEKPPSEARVYVHPINAASVKPDPGAGDVVSITDALFIAQMLAGIRDNSYRMTSASASRAKAARSRTIMTSQSTTVEVGSASLPSGGNAQIPVAVKTISDGLGLGSYDFKVTFNPQVIRVDNVHAGSFASPTRNIDNTNGVVLFNAFQSGVPGPMGDVTVAYLDITALGASGSSTPLDISITTVSNSDGESILATDVDGSVTIQ